MVTSRNLIYKPFKYLCILWKICRCVFLGLQFLFFFLSTFRLSLLSFMYQWQIPGVLTQGCWRYFFATTKFQNGMKRLFFIQKLCKIIGKSGWFQRLGTILSAQIYTECRDGGWHVEFTVLGICYIFITWGNI